MKKTEIQSAISTALISLLILLYLLYFGMSLSKEDMEEGVMISFGEMLDGYGEQTPVAASSKPATPKVETPKPSERLMTQDDESVALEQEKKRKLQEQRVQEQQERERVERERAAEAQRKAAELERERKAQEAKNLASGAFSQSTGQGSGTTTGEAMQGNPAGKGQQNGHSWSLSGRDIKGKLAEPTYSGKQEGIIVVNIRVDQSGRVTEASIGHGTTITEEGLRNLSLVAARSNKFSAGNGIVLGTITYRFVLK